VCGSRVLRETDNSCRVEPNEGDGNLGSPALHSGNLQR